MAKGKKKRTPQPISNDALKVGGGIVSFSLKEFMSLRVDEDGEVKLGDTPVEVGPLPSTDIQLLAECAANKTLH